MEWYKTKAITAGVSVKLEQRMKKVRKMKWIRLLKIEYIITI